MAYRDQPVDPRIRELEALIATEPGLRTQLVPIRIAHDEVLSRVDVIGPRLSELAAELAKRREGGVRATLTGWFGRSLEQLEAEVTQLTAELEASTARAAELAGAERTLWKQITAAVDARAELAAMRERAVEALRIAGGPLGDEVRALDADDAHDLRHRELIARQLDTVDLAHTALQTVIAIRGELAALHGTGSKVNVVFELIDTPFGAPETYADREAASVALADAIAEAVIQLRAVVDHYDDARCPWFAELPRERVVGYVNAKRAPLDKVETTPLAADADLLADAMFELLRGLAEVRDRLLRQRDERQRRRLELVGLAG